MKLSRREQILKLVVEYFIETAEPVGSNTLMNKYNLPYSSATIRAELNALEKTGYLEKVHASSGRVPSSFGYRYYVDNLRDYTVDKEVKQQLNMLLSDSTQSVEEVINDACDILAHMTNLASFVLGPSAEEERLINIQIVPLSPTVATAIFITDQGYVENKTFIMPNGVNAHEVQRVVKLINDRIAGTPISQVLEKMEALRPLVSDYLYEHTVIFQVLLDTFAKFAADRLSLYARDSLYSGSESYKDAEKVGRVLNLLDDQSLLHHLLNETGEEVRVFIGKGGDEVDTSVVTSKVMIPGRKPGTIAVIGPTRMDYAHVVATLEYVVDELEKYFRRLANI